MALRRAERNPPLVQTNLPMPRNTTDLAVIVLAAGMGTRMKSQRPKVMQEIAGRPMIAHVVAAAAPLKPARLVLVVGPDDQVVERAARAAAPSLNITTVVQHERLGTGHAVKQAKAALAGHRGDVVVIFGDTPLVTTETLRKLVQARRRSKHAAVAAGFRPADPKLFARLVLDERGRLERIVEARDASPDELKIEMCNAGFIAVDGALLFDLIGRLRNENAKNEYYLFDIIRLAWQRDRVCGHVEIPVEDAFGVDTRQAQAEAEEMIQTRLRKRALARRRSTACAGHGVPFRRHQAWRRRRHRAHVVFGPGVVVGDGVRIRSIGPFARLRPGALDRRRRPCRQLRRDQGHRAGCRARRPTTSAYIGDATVGAGEHRRRHHHLQLRRRRTSTAPRSARAPSSARTPRWWRRCASARRAVGAGSVITKTCRTTRWPSRAEQRR
jgi:bifunctional UDP-N-acetylglucosamine pyrophosphorylase / glucosamine-1-phosphate N-acetyltransferase